MKLHYKKLDSNGITHLVVALIFMVGAGVVGSYLLVASHADPLSEDSADSSSYSYVLASSHDSTKAYACKIGNTLHTKYIVGKISKIYSGGILDSSMFRRSGGGYAFTAKHSYTYKKGTSTHSVTIPSGTVEASVGLASAYGDTVNGTVNIGTLVYCNHGGGN